MYKRRTSQQDLELFDDFVFSEGDTIGTVIYSEYRQD